MAKVVYLDTNIIIDLFEESRPCYESSKKIIQEFKQRYIHLLVNYTESYSKEFFLLLTWRGQVLLGEGEEKRISLPLVRGVIFAHTHPSGTCMPSYNDVISFQDFFGEGGLVEFIISKRCYLVAYTESLLEDDYWKLHDVATCIRKSKNYNDYMKCLNALYLMKSVWVETGII